MHKRKMFAFRERPSLGVKAVYEKVFVFRQLRRDMFTTTF